ncbi:type II toxin-antitoxin system HicA family toxin [bacterium]|nr:type II toxin-antitoxin system HicA family toxin [bacterium]
MPRLPVISGKLALRVFERLGWRFARRKGSHMMLTKPGVPVNLAIPDHRELDAGTLRMLIRKAELTVELFLDAWHSL